MKVALTFGILLTAGCLFGQPSLPNFVAPPATIYFAMATVSTNGTLSAFSNETSFANGTPCDLTWSPPPCPLSGYALFYGYRSTEYGHVVYIDATNTSYTFPPPQPDEVLRVGVELLQSHDLINWRTNYARLLITNPLPVGFFKLGNRPIHIERIQ